MTPKKLLVWRITEIGGKRGHYLGSVMAADDKAAIAKAIEEFGITDAHRKRRLVAQRES